MKYVKMLGLLAVAAAAMMAFAGVASATTVTAPEGNTYFGEIHAESEGHAILHNPIAKIECPSTVTGDITVNGTNHEGVTANASGNLTEVLFGIPTKAGPPHQAARPCTNSWHVTTVTGGTLSIKSNGNMTGDLFSSGATVEATRFGVTCRYVTNNTTIGTVTSKTATKNATLHIEADIPFHNGSFLCGEGVTKWTGSYEATAPGGITID